MALITITSCYLLQAKDRDYGLAGKWVLDKKSEQPPNVPAGLEQKIKLNGAAMTVESTFKEPPVAQLLYLGVLTDTLHLSTDGQEVQNTVGPFQSVWKSTLEGQTKLQTEWRAEFDGKSVEGHWTHTLSLDGKQMTLEIEAGPPDGPKNRATLTFVRK